MTSDASATNSTNDDEAADEGAAPSENDCQSLEILVGHSDEQTREKLVEVIQELGHRLDKVCGDVPMLREACIPSPPDLILTGIQMEGGDVVDTLVEISHHEPTPAIVITPKESLIEVEKALRDHVMAYLVEPLDVDQIKPTIYLVCERFKQFELLKAENDDLKQTLADRKLIERAKGILMGQDSLTEEEAFRRLQKLAQSKRTKLAKIAAAVIEAAEQDAE